jgi:integrase/recombinase XerD
MQLEGEGQMSYPPPQGRGRSVLGSLFVSPSRPRGGALFDRHLEDFLLRAQGEGLAPKTLVKLQRLTSELARWMSRECGCHWCNAHAEDLRRYLSGFASTSASTIAGRRWMLARLYRWATSEGLVDEDPVKGFARMRGLPKARPYAPTEAQVLRLMLVPDTGTALGLRDRAVLELLYATGLRAAELAGLRMHQIQREENAINVTGKGSRERVVIYGEHAGYWLEQYLSWAREELLAKAKGGRTTDALFVHPTSLLSLRYFHLLAMVKQHALAANLPLVTPHTLRHAFATHLKDRGMDLRSIQTLLGHDDLDTTTVYIRTRMAILRDLIEESHPQGQRYDQEHRTGTAISAARRPSLVPDRAASESAGQTQAEPPVAAHVSSPVLSAQVEHVAVPRVVGEEEGPGRPDREAAQGGSGGRAGGNPRPNRRVRIYGPRSLPMARAQENGPSQVLRRADRSHVVGQRKAAQMDPGQGP